MMINIRNAALAATVTLTASSAVSAVEFIDIDMAGFEAFGDFTNPLNTSVTRFISPSAEIVSAQVVNFTFTTVNGSWPREFVISINDSLNTGAPGTFWDSRLSDSTAANTTVGPLNVPFRAPGQFNSGPPLTLLPDGLAVVYVYETFDDPLSNPAAPTIRDAFVNSGILRIGFNPIPEPAGLGVLAFTGMAALRRRRA